MADKNLCIKCGKCTAGCPTQIDIPKYLAAYSGSLPTTEIASVGKPLDCIECGYCSLCCPKKIDVLAIIREMAMNECGNQIPTDPKEAL